MMIVIISKFKFERFENFEIQEIKIILNSYKLTING